MRKLGWTLLAVQVAACNCGSGKGALSQNDAVTACVIAEACFPNEWASGFFGGSLAVCASGGNILPPDPGTLLGSQPISTGLEGPLADIYRCMVAAGGNCAKAAACFGRDGTSGSCSPPGSLQTGTCDGGVLSGCSADGFAFDVNCASYGETCHTDPLLFFGTDGVCDLGACPARTQCVGSQAQVCEGPGVWLVDCARLGTSCVELADGGGATCLGSGSCAADGGPATCDGTVIVACSSGIPTLEDCAQNGTFQRCDNGACVETGNQCTVDGTPATCDGPKVKVCQDGTFREVDCATLGFQGCQGGACTPGPRTGGADGGADAGCAGFGLSCQDSACCAGLSCDYITDACHVSYGDSCTGVDDICVTPYTCLGTGACGTAASCGTYGTGGCTANGCCTGLSCESLSGNCYLANGAACTGQLCAAPDVCLASGVCGTAPVCGAYGTGGCTAASCCSGLTCDSAAAICYVANGAPCSGQTCATPYTCLATGDCGTAPACLPQNSACTIGGEACCTGYACTKSRGSYVCL